VVWAFEAWNQTAQRCGLASASKLTPDRVAKIRARLNAYGRDGWERALRNLERSAFLRGNNDRGWRADLEFVLQASSFAKLHDGAYGDDGATPHRKGSNGAGPTQSAAELHAKLERVRQNDVRECNE
jgi:hypothetical protein